MTFSVIKEAVLRLTDEERLELLNWMLENFDANGHPISVPMPEQESTRPTLSS